MKITKLKFLSLFFGIAVLGLVSNSGTVKALQFNIDTIPLIEAVEYLPQEEFIDQTKLVEFTPAEDNNLSYEIRLPKKWQETSVLGQIILNGELGGDKVLGEITMYNGEANPLSGRNSFSVSAMKLSYEIGARNWFINYVLSNGLSLEYLTEVNKKEVLAMYVEVVKDVTYIVRVRAIINGNKMIVARYAVTQDTFKKEEVMQAQSIDSFKLKNADTSPIEKLVTYGFLSQSYFDYPPSWVLNAPKINSINNMKVQLHNNTIKDMLDGQINVELTNKLSNLSRSDIVKTFREEFKVEGYEVGKFIESPTIEIHPEMTFGTMQAYELKPVNSSDMIEYELWVTILEGENYIYLVALYTPSREEDFFKWARNIESYKLIVSTMRRHDESDKVLEFIK